MDFRLKTEVIFVYITDESTIVSGDGAMAQKEGRLMVSIISQGEADRPLVNNPIHPRSHHSRASETIDDER